MKETEQDQRAGDSEGFVAVARIARTRGLRGELVADLLTDFPERFDTLDSVVALLPNGQREQLTIEEHWFQRNRIVFKFAGYDSIEASKALLGCELAVPESERVQLLADQFYDWELVGCLVETVPGEQVGCVHDVMRTGGVEMLVVANEHGRELLIPMAQDICVEIDVERKLIRVDPPEGLLEL
jgi:16S rRNA processing protein RimM